MLTQAYPLCLIPPEMADAQYTRLVEGIRVKGLLRSTPQYKSNLEVSKWPLLLFQLT